MLVRVSLISGATTADLVPTKFIEVDRPPLPPVTVVFVAVADADVLVRQKPVVAEAVHYALGSVMQVCVTFMCRLTATRVDLSMHECLDRLSFLAPSAEV